MASSRSTEMGRFISRIIQLKELAAQSRSHRCYTSAQTQVLNQCSENAICSSENRFNNQTEVLKSSLLSQLVNNTQVRVQIRSYSSATQSHIRKQKEDKASPEDQRESGKKLANRNHQIGHNVSRKDKISFLVATLIDLPDDKEALYSALDAFVAWEQSFPIGSLKNVLIALEKEQQWHRVVQVIKWMLSKGQGNTMGTFGQLIRALDMDHRAEEAHEIWVKKIGNDLHSVPWSLCDHMLSIYYRNNMFRELVMLFRGLQAFDRTPPSKSVVQKVTNAYELLGFVEESDKLLVKYESLLAKTGRPKKSKKVPEKSKNVSRKMKKT